MTELTPARWPNGPKFCPATNLPAFPTQKEMKAFQRELRSRALEEWECRKCGCWHYWGHPPAPAGQTSGTERPYEMPEAIRVLILLTKKRPNS